MSDQPELEKTYDVRDLQNRYSVTERTVLQWIWSGELKAINVGVGTDRKKPRWRITQAAITAFEESRTSA